MEIKCSIIIPTFKGSNSVRNAVVSALKQNSIDDMEIIVVDDNGNGSEEQKKTELMLLDFIQNEQIVYLIHDVNRNGSAARNTGLSHAKGRYISFLDDDDYLLSDTIEKEIKMLEQFPDFGMCVCSGCYVNKDGVGYKKVLCQKKDFLFRYLLDKVYFNTSAILFRKESLIRVGGFDESFRRHQDWELVTRILSEQEACVMKDVGMIRYLEERNTPRSFAQRIDNLEHFFSVCEEYMYKKLSIGQVNRVKTFRRREICQSMLLAGLFKQAYEYGKTYGGNLELLKAVIFMIPLVFRKIIWGSRKVAVSKATLNTGAN